MPTRVINRKSSSSPSGGLHRGPERVILALIATIGTFTAAMGALAGSLPVEGSTVPFIVTVVGIVLFAVLVVFLAGVYVWRWCR